VVAEAAIYFFGAQAPHFLAAQAPPFLAAQAPHFLAAAAVQPPALQRARHAPLAQPPSAAAVTTAEASVRVSWVDNEVM
jgi:hypothetical protein